MVDADNSSAVRAHRAGDWWIQAFQVTVVIYFYVLMEWLFFATKPSFMSVLSLVERAEIFWITPIPLLAAGMVCLLVSWVPAAVAGGNQARAICYAAGSLFPALIMSLAIFLMIDNFTYTVFDFGVRSASGIFRAVYALVLLALLVLSYRFLYEKGKRIALYGPPRACYFLIPLMITISVVFAVAAYVSSERVQRGPDTAGSAIERRPDILIISSDGLNADNMSAYGYHRDTTPFIGELAGKALFCENNFTNAGTSAASIASMFTGKLPTRTRLIYHPDILRGIDAYQHLPGILRRHGYRNIEISIRHHTDPYDLNMRDSFDVANRRSVAGRHMPDWSDLILGQEPSYFLGKMYDRASDRILHAFGAREMVDPFAEVVKSGMEYSTDAARIKDLFSFIDGSTAPFFAHLHLLGTHGPLFGFIERKFSAGQKQEDHWMTDFYDDAILTFDSQVEGIVDSLADRELLDNTVIVICSDHGQGWSYDLRLPLLFLFPEGEHAGRIAANTQNLDIPPTLLDYLGIGQPEWMEGQSLISSAPDPGRMIFVVDRRHGLTGVGKRRKAGDAEVGPPFYTLGSVGVFLCDKLFMLDLDESRLTVSDVQGHSAPCGGGDFPPPEEIGRIIVDHLIESGYDTSSIKASLQIGE